MKFFLLFFAFTTFSLELISQAGGVITIKGKLTSITSTQYIIETKNMVYSISKSAVTPDQAEKLERTEIEVALPVPLEAVEKVKSKTSHK
jgi:hypothetical protein